MAFGFTIGGVYQDYTMCTLMRDKRSCGSILTKVVGYILQEIGISIWYWGYKCEYMEEYCKHYGAKEIDRIEFYDIWQKEKDKTIKPFLQI